MPNRIIREGLVDSERINALSPSAECFFYRLMLKADDHGCYTGHRTLIRAALYPLKQKMTDDYIDQFIAECVHVDLLREYQHEGKKFLYIPRFGQRLRSMKSRWPEPPKAVVDGHLRTSAAVSGQTREQESLSDLLTNDGLNLNLRRESEAEVSGTNVPSSGHPPMTPADQPKKVAIKINGSPQNILDLMNMRLGRDFRAYTPNGKLTANGKLIADRLKDGHTEAECRAVFANRFDKWGTDDKMREFLRPSTLFRASNFETYLGETRSIDVAEQERIMGDIRARVQREKQTNGGSSHG